MGGERNRGIPNPFVKTECVVSRIIPLWGAAQKKKKAKRPTKKHYQSDSARGPVGVAKTKNRPTELGIMGHDPDVEKKSDK